MKNIFIKNKKVSLNRGATLIELLLYISLSGILLLAVCLFFYLSLNARIKSESMRAVKRDGAHVMEVLTSLVRASQYIGTPSVGSSEDGMKLKMSDESRSFTATIFVRDGVLYFDDDQGALPLTSNHTKIDKVSFTNLSPFDDKGSVQIMFVLSSLSDSTRNEYEYSQTFYATATQRK
jgi:Tfp pilus assembly protein PilW